MRNCTAWLHIAAVVLREVHSPAACLRCRHASNLWSTRTRNESQILI